MNSVEYEAEDIRWMQISDLHIGSQYYQWTNETLKERFRYLFAEGLIPRLQFIIITGDIIDRGQIKQIDYTCELKNFLGILQEYTDQIIITPGNHDYIRNKSRLDLLTNWKKESIDNKKEQEEEYSKKLTADFDAILNLFSKEGYTKDKQSFNQKGTISNITVSTKPDVIVLDGINIVSINTSVFSGQPKLDGSGNVVKKNGSPLIEDNGYLWLCESDLPPYRSLNHNFPAIMIGHHPLEMFAENSRALIKKFCKECGITQYFCGHMHEMKSSFDDLITQHTSAGLFEGTYNIPSFSIYSIKKNANQTIDQTTYCWDGDWENIGNSSFRCNAEETKTRDRCHTEPKLVTQQRKNFVINPSEISDGAISIPYGEGVFNIYISKDEPSTITIPHKHNDVDEVTYVTKGSLFVVIDDIPHFISEGKAIFMPKDKFHGLIPISFPCEYLTMSCEGKASINWSEDIKKIRQYDKQLSDNLIGLYGYNQIIEYLSSPIMEVRWEAEETLNKRLVQENNADNAFIREAVGTKIRPAIRSDNINDQLFGLSIAYELGIEISDEDIIMLLKSNNFMITWVCAYYLLKYKKRVDIQKVYEQISQEKIYQRIILSVLRLIIFHNGSILKDNYDEFSEKCKEKGGFAVSDILMYFTIWYTSFTYMDQELDYSKASDLFYKLFDGDGEKILRGFTNVQDNNERFLQIQKCNAENKLLDAVCAYFESTYDVTDTAQTDELLKDRIENYLRIIVSEKCNLQCVYCHHEGRIDSLLGEKISPNPRFNLHDLLQKAKKLHFKKIKISGGEPLLFPNVLSICSDFQNDFEDIGFTTNGTQIAALRTDFEKIKGSKLSFNVTLNTLNKEKNKIITGEDCLQDTKKGIDYLVENGFKVKLNSVITSYNFDEITDLISYAARQRINIKLLDLFSIENTPPEFKHVSISEIKSEVMKKFRLGESDFIREEDYLTAQVMGIKVLIPSRVYSMDCQFNCKMYPCAEGIFGIRIFEDYSCTKCFCGTIYRGGLMQMESSISQIRKELNALRFSY